MSRPKRQPPWPEWRLAPCGTTAAYRRHLRRGEPVDEACRQAERLRTAERDHLAGTGLTPDYRPVRNGIPVRFYVYRGTGHDIYEGEAS